MISKDLFATRIWSFDCPELQEQNPVWQAAIAAMRQAAPDFKTRSNRLGWSSDRSLLGRPEFARLHAAIRLAVEHVLKEYQPLREVRFGVEAWANVLDPGGCNMLHSHPNCLLSGVYYLNMPAGAGGLVFRDPRPGSVLQEFPGKGVHCGTLVRLDPKPQQLVVFPNWLEHQVEVNEASEPRVAVAFNAMRAFAA